MGPGYNYILGPLLKDAKQRLDAGHASWQQARITGIVLVSDGWTDTKHRPLIIVLAATSKGHCFQFEESCEGKPRHAVFTSV